MGGIQTSLRVYAPSNAIAQICNQRLNTKLRDFFLLFLYGHPLKTEAVRSARDSSFLLWSESAFSLVRVSLGHISQIWRFPYGCVLALRRVGTFKSASDRKFLQFGHDPKPVPSGAGMCVRG